MQLRVRGVVMKWICGLVGNTQLLLNRNSLAFPLRRLCLLGIVLALATTLSGCGGNDNLAYVSGTVRLDGQPLPKAFIVFAPASGGTTSYGRTDENGRYEMMFSDTEKGAWLGENRVEISTGDVDASGTGGGAREQVPAVYNQRSTLKVDVASGDNVHDFDLQSNAGQIIQLPPE